MWTLPEEGAARAKAYALKALELDDDLAEAHASLALIKMLHDWDWPGATEEAGRAVELNPGYVMSHAAAALRHALVGRPEDAVAAAKRALELDPLSPRGNARLGLYYEFAGDEQKAVERWQDAIKLDPTYSSAHRDLGVYYCRTGMAASGIPLLEKARALDPEDPRILGELGYCHARHGADQEARDLLETLEDLSRDQHVSPMAFVTLHLGLGQHDEALAWLETAYELRDPGLVYALRMFPPYAPLGSDARFQDQVRRVGLPQG
jgi:serine/threonine-protein kinase